MRSNLFYIEKGEAIEILICVLALSLALAVSTQGIEVLFNLRSLVFIMAFFIVTVGSGFILHEMAHKVLAIYYGAYARFNMWLHGLLLMFVFAFFFGFVFAAPGAVYIYSHSITKRQNGLISAVGPLTNLLIMVVFIFLAFYAPIHFDKFNLWGFGAKINAFLAFFNMLPIFPLDGSKVFAWNFIAGLLLIGVSFYFSFLF